MQLVASLTVPHVWPKVNAAHIFRTYSKNESRPLTLGEDLSLLETLISITTNSALVEQVDPNEIREISKSLMYLRPGVLVSFSCLLLFRSICKCQRVSLLLGCLSEATPEDFLVDRLPFGVLWGLPDVYFFILITSLVSKCEGKKFFKINYSRFCFVLLCFLQRITGY